MLNFCDKIESQKNAKSMGWGWRSTNAIFQYILFKSHNYLGGTFLFSLGCMNQVEYCTGPLGKHYIINLYAALANRQHLF